MDLEVSEWGSSKMFVGTYRWFGSSFSFFYVQKDLTWPNHGSRILPRFGAPKAVDGLSALNLGPLSLEQWLAPC